MASLLSARLPPQPSMSASPPWLSGAARDFEESASSLG
jgi:hypothetical protein